jgi:hypothetical protein
VPPRNPYAFSLPTYALRKIDGCAAVPSEAMLFTLNMLFTQNMRASGNCYTLFLFHLEMIFRGGAGIINAGDAFYPDHIAGALQGTGVDAQPRHLE